MAEQPTAEEMKQGAEVAVAATEAAQAEPTPEKARTAAKRAVKRAAPASFQLTDEQCEQIAAGVVQQMEDRGAFEAPPEQLQPAPVSVPEAPGPMPVQEQQQPQKRTFAEKFRGR